MSHPLYNPYASGNQSSTQGQYGLFGKSVRERTLGEPLLTLDLGPPSTLLEVLPATPANSGGMLPSLISQPVSYRSEQRRAIMDEDIERSIDMHISRAREEVRLLDKSDASAAGPRIGFPTRIPFVTLRTAELFRITVNIQSGMLPSLCQKQTDLEAMVKTLAPALLAELAKMEVLPISSSLCQREKKILFLHVTKRGQPSSSPSVHSKEGADFQSLLKQSPASRRTKKSGKSRPPTMLRLEGICRSLSHNDVITAVERFGKTKSVVLFRATQEETVSTEPSKPPQKNLATSSVSIPQTTKSTTTTNVPLTPKLPTLKRPVSSGAKTATTGKPTRQKIAAKGSAKSLRTVNKAKILVSKAKNIIDKQKAKTVKPRKLPAKGAVKKINSSGSIAPANQPVDGESKIKDVLDTSETKVQEAVVVLEETAEVDKSVNRTVYEPSKGTMIEVPKAETTEKPKTLADRLAITEVTAKEIVEQTAAKAVGVPSKSTVLENRAGLETSRPIKSETKVKESMVVLEDKAEFDKSANKTVAEPPKGTVIEASKAETALPTQKPKTSADKLAEIEAMAKEEEETTKKACQKNQPCLENFSPDESETKVQESLEVLEETAAVDKSANTTVAESSKGTVIEAPKAETAQKPKTSADRLAEVESVAKENIEEIAPETMSVPSKFTVSENQLGFENFKPNKSETKVQEAVVVWEETAEDDKSASRTAAEPYKGTVIEVPKAETGQKAKTPGDRLAEVESVAKEKVEETAPKPVSVPLKSTVSENQPDVGNSKPYKSETKVVHAVGVLKETADVTDFEHRPQAELDEVPKPLELVEPGAEVSEPMEVGSHAKDPVTAVKTETDVESANDASKVVRIVIATSTGMTVSVRTEPTASGASEEQLAASTLPSTAVTPLTIGEMVEKHLHQNKINLLRLSMCFSSKFFQLGKKLLLITGLPVYSDGRYSEDDVVKLLLPFGFQHKEENLYVVHQARMAFFVMPKVGYVHHIMKISRGVGIIFKGSKLCFHVVNNGITMTPFGFYKSLMKLMNSSTVDDGSRTVFIKSVSPSEARNLRGTLRKIGSVKNYLPLLNKVFIEFESVCDADRLGVWYSLLKRAPCHKVERLKVPTSSSTMQVHSSRICCRTNFIFHAYLCSSSIPRLPHNALPDSKDLADGTTIPQAKHGVPQGSVSPFWLTMTNSPFLFPTISPWFNIPDHLTVKGKGDIEKASRCSSMFSTVMLTGLPVENYKHEDVAKLVWKYFPKQSLQSLYYNVMVLTLQRRFFLLSVLPPFNPRPLCFSLTGLHAVNFLQDHIKYSFSVMGYTLSVHLVLEHMHPESSEEMMYKSLMKWSNAGVSEPESLEERLLSVEISETSLDVITVVLEVVMSIATFDSFLPLANRICIEMADCSGVTQVVEEVQDCLIRLTTPEQNLPELPQIDVNIFNALTAAVRQYRLTQDGKSQSEEKEDQKDFTDDVVLSDAYLFDEQNFNMDDFVTIDEVGDDEEDTSPEPQSSSSSRQSSRAGRSKRQNSDVSSSGKRTSTRSSKDSSKSTKDSSKSSSVLPKKSNDSSEATKSQTKPLSSANVNQDKTKQEEREDDKHAEVEVEEDDIENYQILDSLDDQTDEQMHDGDELTGPKEGQTLQEENYQILDSVDSEGNACPEEDSEMKIGRILFQVLDSVTQDQATTGQEDSRLVQVSDSVDEEVVEDDRPSRGGKGKRGRPKKEVKTTKKGKDVSDRKAEEEATYQILDSVEEETVDDEPPSGCSENTRKEILAGSTKNEEDDEEPLYQIVDSLEDDQEEPTATEVSDRGRKEKNKLNDETCTKDTEKEDTCGSTAVRVSEKVLVKGETLYEIIDDQEKQKSPKKNDRTSALVNLDEVSEAEDYPDDDTTEEEELRKRQAASKERQLAKEREERRTREREERERRSRSSSSRGGGGTRRTKEETVEVDVKELVTLDEREDGKAERSTPETRPPSQDDESGDSLNPETLVTLDEAGGDEEEKPDEERAEKSSRSAKRKQRRQHR
ncbi:hypothetical protein L3Q82_016703 [Scortum barcoo]|uniref:Uncharacterized protein n=1 Tax=Scortum barcoo TaxID=214431 RepID=A0ACB8X7V7_9TELE|nr:hypothetical protein L3Q82_016703 [Scortum barcoo]